MSEWAFTSFHQPTEGFRYGIDSFLLVRFMRLEKGDLLCDLGTGVGILGLLALERRGVASVSAFEVQKELADLALKNSEERGFSDRMRVFHENWKKVPQLLPRSSFEVVVSNPPYRKKDTGRVPPNPIKAIAKHEIEGTMQEIIDAARYLMKPEGRFYLMYPPLRLEECLIELNRAQLKVQRMGFVHSYIEHPAKLFMVEAVKSEPRELHVEAPVIIYQDPDHYTEEVEAWVGKKKR
jgi:tRNA1Val (adenine37-N6)-methyltransferase